VTTQWDVMIFTRVFHLLRPSGGPQVMDSVQTLDAGRRSMYDPDEIEEEQRERETRNKVSTGLYIYKAHSIGAF
jgi:hypothetical protein